MNSIIDRITGLRGFVQLIKMIFIYPRNIGRTGRAGKTGRAITFFTEEDVTHLRRYVAFSLSD